MKNLYQILCAVFSGVLVCFSFPTIFFGWYAPDLGWLAWIALVPLILVMRNQVPRRAFFLTFIAGLIAYAGSLYWIYRAMNTYGGMSSLLSVLVLILLVVILAIYMALASFFARFIQSRWRGEFIALLPVCWVAFEFCRNYFPCNGFPWSNIAMSQWSNLHIIQITDVVGVYGLMFLIVWVNVMIAEIILRIRGEHVSMLIPKVATTVVLVTVTIVYGAIRLNQEITTENTEGIVKVGLIQGNIPQDEKWAEEKMAQNLHKYRKATRKLRDAAVDLIIWPEASFPWTMSTDETDIDPRALGFDEEELSEMPHVMFGVLTKRPDGEYHNSAVVFDAKGKRKNLYHKVHLVPFGEYVPYEKVFFFARKLAEPVGSFIAGSSFDPIVAAGAKIGPLICYEDIFPEISRKMAKSGAQFLANITNDAWYGVSSAPYQHMALAVFRAVENRRYVVRSTNTGVSAVIAPNGKIEMESGLFEDALIVAPIRLIKETTLYTRLGDWFAWACVAYMAVGIIVAFVMKYRRAR
ncbi:MAG: apolipoprotein N-acyltransferase [Pseudomonadota bacterium]